MNALQEHMDQIEIDEISFEVTMDMLQNILSGDVNKRDSAGNTVLHLALQQIKTNVVYLVEHLLENGAEVNALNYSGLSPLHYAIIYQNCSVDVLKLLFDSGAKIYQKTHLGLTPLDYAMEKDFPLDAIRFLFEKAEKIHLTSELAISLMHYAIERNLPIDLVQLLLDKGIDYNVVSGTNNLGETSMHIAVAFKRKEILKLLLKQPGVQIDLPDCMGFSPFLHAVAASKCDIDIIKLLLDSDSNVEKATRNGMRAIHFAMYFCKIEVVKLLLKHGAQVNVTEKCGRSPLYLAVKFCPNDTTVEALKLLLDAGASVFFSQPSRSVSQRNALYDDATSALVAASQKHYRFQSEDSLQRVQLLLKYALLERPEISYEKLSDDRQICALLSQYGSACLRELHSTCNDGNITLAQFILRQRRQESEFRTDEILKMLVANAHPLYREVIASLLKKEELEEKFKERSLFMPKQGLGQACALRRFVLHYDALCCLMRYLSKEELLHLLLSFYKEHADMHVGNSVPSDASQNVMEAESERVFKRPKIN